MKEEKRKWVMPKFLPHKYDVKLINEDKVRISPVTSTFERRGVGAHSFTHGALEFF